LRETSVVSSTAGADAVTVIASATLLIFISASARAVEARRTETVFVTLAMPSTSKPTVYRPGGSDGNVYPPPSPVIVVRVPWSAGELMVTVTPGNAAPSLVTVPTRVPVV
jgi:hypothetical protein